MRPSTESFLDTIAALATPVGRSALALLRVSGQDAGRVLRSVTRGLPEPLTARRPELVFFVDQAGDTIDRGLATLFVGPASATGEDVAELSVHGSPIVVERLLAALRAAGARPARPGEFTTRSFLAGKVDLVEAEAVRDLIDARTPAAARASACRLEGRLSERLQAVRQVLVAAAAQLAATIDFAEDVGEQVPSSTRPLLAKAAQELARLASTYETGRLLSAGCRVALLGRPNAGKSTLFNALLGSARAIVTEIPGTTRDTLEATIDIGGIPVALVDTAGLRQTDDVVESMGVERAREAGESADAVLYIFDAAAGWAQEDANVIAELDGKPLIVIANKIDRVSDYRIQDSENAMPGMPLCGLEAAAGDRLRALLEETLASRIATDVSSEVLGSLRQRDLIERSRACAVQALEALERRDSPEYAATHVDLAIDALADVVGETTAQDVLEQIFSTFCIGK